MTLAHKHHRKRRSQGGDDSYGNLIELSPEVHELVHRNPVVAFDHGLLVHSYDDPAKIRPDVEGFLASLGVEGKSEPEKKPKKRLDGEARRKRKTISVKVPNDEENGGEIWDETIGRVKDRLVAMGLYESDAPIPNYEALIAALNDWLNS